MKSVTCDLIVAGKPTINERVYSEECLCGFVRQCNTHLDGMFTTLGFDEGSQLRLSSVVATVRNFSLSVSGTVVADIEVLPHSPVTEAMLDTFDFSPMVMGTVDSDGIVRDAVVTYWTLTPKEEG
jgi:hypothetical protein